MEAWIGISENGRNLSDPFARIVLLRNLMEMKSLLRMREKVRKEKVKIIALLMEKGKEAKNLGMTKVREKTIVLLIMKTLDLIMTTMDRITIATMREVTMRIRDVVWRKMMKEPS